MLCQNIFQLTPVYFQFFNLFSKSADGGCFFSYIFIENSNTIYSPRSTTKASACETTQTKTNTSVDAIEKNLNMFRTNNLSICRVYCKILLFGVCLSAPFIYIGYNLFSIRTPRIRKYAKLPLKDKRFELENLTGAVEKVFITGQRSTSWDFIVLYPTFDWLNLKMLESFVSVLPCDWFSLSGWPRFL